MQINTVQTVCLILLIGLLAMGSRPVSKVCLWVILTRWADGFSKLLWPRPCAQTHTHKVERIEVGGCVRACVCQGPSDSSHNWCTHHCILHLNVTNGVQSDYRVNYGGGTWLEIFHMLIVSFWIYNEDIKFTLKIQPIYFQIQLHNRTHNVLFWKLKIWYLPKNIILRGAIIQ